MCECPSDCNEIMLGPPTICNRGLLGTSLSMQTACDWQACWPCSCQSSSVLWASLPIAQQHVDGHPHLSAQASLMFAQLQCLLG